MSPEGPLDRVAEPIDGGVGQHRRHDSAEKHVAGAAQYVDDAPEPPGALHVQFGLSQTAHGRLKTLDLAAVRAAPGVVGVFTAADIVGKNDVSPVMGDDPMFAEDVVSYWGQALFAVAAETRDAARRAARLARVEIEDRPAILTIDAAMDAQSWL
ncbi:MAG: xanthine dehydrogenase molybdopterin binding subunit, partial [Pseudomonadota bacterium]